MKNLKIIVVIIYLFMVSISYALTSDNSLPMDLIAETVNFNNNTGVTIFTGNVKIDQGTTHLRADKVSVYKNSDGEIEKIIAIGNPAHYSALPENEAKVMDAFGKTITYYPLQKRAIILGDGLIKQGNNTFNAEHIVYDIAKETVTSIPTADGKKAKLVLQPKEMPGTKKNQ